MLHGPICRSGCRGRVRDYPNMFGQFQDWFSTEEACFSTCETALEPGCAQPPVRENELFTCVSGHSLDLVPICLGDFRRERDQGVGPGLGNPTGARLGPLSPAI